MTVKAPIPYDEMQGALIDPMFYSVLKEWGYPTARYKNGMYKDERAQVAWCAYRCGSMDVSCESLDDEEWPPV